MTPLETVAQELIEALKPLRFGAPVTHVYNPLEYAWEPHSRYLREYGQGRPEAVFLGMNPGPWGMAQTGIPFGEVNLARDWLNVAAPVGKPANEHPKRQILGFDSPRSEVSGARIWGWAKETWQQPKDFFDRFFVVNYCPLSFMEESGRNRTPDKLPAAERAPLFDACDRALYQTIEILQPRMVIGVGVFAEKRARTTLAGLDVEFGRILHPSPASPKANRGWAEAAMAELAALGIAVP